MSTVITGTPRRSRPRLRLATPAHAAAASHVRAAPRARAFAAAVDAPERERARPGQRTELAGHVLVAGSDEAARSGMLEQLRGLLPHGTRFVEARETWQVVAQASDSRMVVLTGDLQDLSARGLMRVLSRRHPLLPVIALGDCTDGAAAQLGAASL